MKGIVMIGSGREVRGGKALRAATSLARLAALLAAGRVSLLHVHIASDASFWRKAVFVSAARAAGVPYVLHVHAGDFEAYHERCSPRTRALLRSLYAGARSVIALSESWRAPIQSAVPGARVEVIPNPVSIPPWNAHAAPRRPIALFLGVVRPEKGIYELLAAWPAVLQALPDGARWWRRWATGRGESPWARPRGCGRGTTFPPMSSCRPSSASGR